MSGAIKSTWWVSTDMIGKPGSPKTAGPFSTREDAFAARMGMEAMGANLSVFEEKPTPPVALPETPTLGWLSSSGNRSVLAVWRRLDLTGGPGIEPHRGEGFRALSREVTAFTEAYAVPKAEYDALMHAVVHDYSDRGVAALARILRDAAVDAAGEGK